MNSYDVTKRAGITYRQLDVWTTRGLVTASGGAGHGSRREYESSEARVIIDMGALVRAGMSPTSAAETVRALPRIGMMRPLGGEFVIMRSVTA